LQDSIQPACWYFPYVPFSIYFWAAPFFYILYTLVLFELYELIKHLLGHHRLMMKVPEHMYDKIMAAELAIGILFSIIWVTYSLSNMAKFSMPFWEISRDSNIPVPWWFGFLFAFSVFFVFDYLAYKRGKPTFTSDLLKGDLRPALSITIANIGAILLMEMVNAPFQLWVYSNWYLQDVKLFTLPIFVILLWPTQFLAFLSLFSAFLIKKKLISGDSYQNRFF